MSKFFDIKPPARHERPASTRNKQSAKKSRSKSSILLFIVFVLGAIFLFSYTNNTNKSYKEVVAVPSTNGIDDLATTVSPTAQINDTTLPSDSPTPTISSEPTNSFTPTPSLEPLNIIVLNGARVAGAADKAKIALESNNLTVTQTGDTQNLYSSSTIYYTEKNAKSAQKIQETLSSYKPSLVIDSSLANDATITVVIGAN